MIGFIVQPVIDQLSRAPLAASEGQNSRGRQLISSSRSPTEKENKYEDLRGQPILRRH